MNNYEKEIDILQEVVSRYIELIVEDYILVQEMNILFLCGIVLVYPYSSEPGTPNSPYEYGSKQYQFMSVANATAAGKAKKLTPADKGNNIH